MRLAFIKLHIAVLLAGFTAILGKLITLNEAALVWWRLLLSVVALLLLFTWLKKSVLTTRKTILQLLGIGSLVGIHWLCFFGSVKYGNVSIALVCFSAAGFFSALLEPVITRRKWRPIELLLGLMCMAGIYIIFHFDTRYKTGILLGVAAAALSALFSILNKQMVNARADGLQMTFWEMSGALITLSVAMPAYVMLRGDSMLPAPLDWLWLLILALVCTVWAFFLQLQALQHISAVTLNLTYNLEPVYGIILAFIFFQENQYLHSTFFAGLIFIALAVAIQMWRVKQGRDR
ncbi:MAG: EamA family transporter [Bacteroidetes bacterium]|uniref:DMT family transporter n=1 Tax=Phnomibacter sp. TaxID=2836217 RepID=UPI002FDEAFBF|nr:EamA family transporter [Bacteroidota bacterium]